MEDLKSEIEQLAIFLSDGCFGGNVSDEQKNLVIELTVMKLKAMAKE